MLMALMRVVVTLVIVAVMIMTFVVVGAKSFALWGEDGFRIGGVFDGLLRSSSVCLPGTCILQRSGSVCVGRVFRAGSKLQEVGNLPHHDAAARGRSFQW